MVLLNILSYYAGFRIISYFDLSKGIRFISRRSSTFFNSFGVIVVVGFCSIMASGIT